MNKHLFGLSAWILGFWIIGSINGFGQPRGGPESAKTLQDFSGAFADLALKVRPSVVQIRTVGFGSAVGGAVGAVVSERGTGSGVIFDGDGYIVTNAHVVKGARYIEVWLNENPPPGGGDSGALQKRSTAARLIGMDQGSDLAVLKINRTGLAPMNMADSDALRQGQIVLAFGNPMALENSVSMGVISSVERQLDLSDPSVYIQTDAPINPGNSGGPLVDVEGNLIGINTLIFSQSGGNEGLGFAIPVNTVKRICAGLRSSGHIHHGHIGIHPLAVTPSLSAGLGLPRDWGVILEDVEPAGPSDRAGLMPGDFILSVDGAAIGRLHELLTAIDRHAIGDVMKVTVLRGAEKIEAGVAIEEPPDDPNRFLEMASENSDLVSGLGILAIDVNDSLLKIIPELRKPAGVLVAALVADSPELEAGLAPGDLIISLNGKSVYNVEALRGLLGDLQTGSPIVLQIQREDQLRYVVLDLPLR